MPSGVGSMTLASRRAVHRDATIGAMTFGETTWAALEAECSDSFEVFAPSSIAGLPEPAQRFLVANLPAGTPLSPAVELELTGEIKLVGHWMGFRARQILRAGVGVDDDRATVSIAGPRERVDVDITVDDVGRLVGIELQRWNDSLKPPADVPFGGEVTSAFDVEGVRIAGQGTVGWNRGSPSQDDDVFFRYTVTSARFLA